MERGDDQRVSEMLYRVVAQAVLLSGADNWILSAEMSRKLKGVHLGSPQTGDGSDIRAEEGRDLET